MKVNMKHIILILILVRVALLATPLIFSLPEGITPEMQAVPMSADEDAPPSNAIGDIEYNAANGDIWISTGNGIAVSHDGGLTWDSKLGGKGFSALAVLGDWIFAAESYDAEDPTDPNGNLPAGNGFYASKDGGLTFTHIDSFVDQDVRRASRIGQLAYDIALVPEDDDTAVYAACFYGGLLYSPDGGESWENLLIDGDDSLDFTDLRHRFFSVAADTFSDPPLVWAGSAEGLFSGRSDDFAWEWSDLYGHWIPESVAVFDTIWTDSVTFEIDSISNFNVLWNDDPDMSGHISGEWIISIDFLYGDDDSCAHVFACTRATGVGVDYDAISHTSDDGTTWNQTGTGYVAWNMGFTGDTLWAACAHGLSRMFPADYDTADTIHIEGTDILTGLPIEVMVDEVVSVTDCGGTILVGTYSEGLAISHDSLDYDFWFILSRFPAPGDASVEAGFDRNDDYVYVYPNPFSPNKHGGCFFVFEPSNSAGDATIELFDYDMGKVTTIYEGGGFYTDKKTRIQWDGALDDGDYPDNGVYFYRISSPDGEFWGKLMIIK